VKPCLSLKEWDGCRSVGDARRNRVETALTKRMATGDASYRKPAAAPCTVEIDRLEGVVRTRRVIATRWPAPRTDDRLISLDQGAEDGAHVVATLCQSPSRLSRIRVAGAPRAAERAPTMRSTAGRRCWACRNDSRIMRRSLLRATAFPITRAPMASPRRGNDPSLGRTASENIPLPRRRPSR